MKKKILSFLVAICMCIPALFMTACGDDPADPPATNPPAHSHAYEHGLCACGDYKGKDLDINTANTCDEIAIGETHYYRFEQTLGQHYTFSKGLASTIKMYAKIGTNWVDLTSGFEGEYLANTASADGYVYLEFKNETDHKLDEFAFLVDEENHVFVSPVQVEVGGSIDLDAETITCVESKTALEAGRTYKVTISNGGSQPTFGISNIFDANGAIEYTTTDTFECTFTATTASQVYFHIYCAGDVEDCQLGLVLVVAD